ncbi:MAG: hypothetical protein H7Y86_05830 [Rhizobacter sp.]|nr:hypothetical protein [Ferruginibacter sp.]
MTVFLVNLSILLHPIHDNISKKETGPGNAGSSNGIFYVNNQLFMKKITSVLLMSLAFMLCITACRKNQSNEDYTETETPVIPVFTEKVNCTVSGFVMDEQSEPIAGATVSAGTAVANTDEFGYFKIQSASLTKNIGLVKISRPGYFTGFKTFIAKENGRHFSRLMLLSKAVSGTVSAINGGSVSTADGATITLPANAMVDALSGAAYSGTVQVSAKLLPVTAINDMLYAIPGDDRGLNTEGHLRSLNTHASIVVDLNGDAGQKLQLATNAKATISLPVAASLQAKAPATVSLWSLDEEKGIWKEEGTLTKTGANYSGQVSHFSFWSGAVSLPLVNFTAQVLSTTLQPLANVPVVITIAGQPLNAGYGKFAFTDASGVVSGSVPANTSFVLNVLTTCSNSSYNHFFTTTNTGIDLGSITGNLGQSLVTLSGTVTNCGGQPLTDGYVQTYDNGFYNRIPVVNGSFSFSGTMCNNLPVNYIAGDNITHQQSVPQSVTIVPGANNLGALSACGINSIGSVTYVIDGTTRTLAEPAQTLAAYYTPAGGITTILRLTGSSGSPDFTFQFGGGTDIGSAHTVSDIWSVGFTSGRALASTPLAVNITEFGDTGGFITGSFTGAVTDFTTGTPHIVTYNFRIKRLN